MRGSILVLDCLCMPRHICAYCTTTAYESLDPHLFIICNQAQLLARALKSMSCIHSECGHRILVWWVAATRWYEQRGLRGADEHAVHTNTHYSPVAMSNIVIYKNVIKTVSASHRVEL